MKPTKYHNVYRDEGFFKYIDKENNIRIFGKDWEDLKNKLSHNGIFLKEKNESSEKNMEFIESEDDVNFGKIHYIDSKTGMAVDLWGPDNSKRARKLRDNLIK